MPSAQPSLISAYCPLILYAPQFALPVLPTFFLLPHLAFLLAMAVGRIVTPGFVEICTKVHSGFAHTYFVYFHVFWARFWAPALV